MSAFDETKLVLSTPLRHSDMDLSFPVALIGKVALSGLAPGVLHFTPVLFCIGRIMRGLYFSKL